MRYPFLKQFAGQFALATLCRVLNVSRSGDYAWLKRPPSAREKANQPLTVQITSVFEQTDQTYGSPRLYQQLKAQGIFCSEKLVARLMRRAALTVVLPKGFGVTTDSKHNLPLADNLLGRPFGS